ncbi:MAG: GNAT family N-acetyltransferase [Bacillota bacterium]
MSFTLRPVPREDYPRMVDIINAQVREPVTAEEVLREDNTRVKGDPFLRLGAYTADGTLVGYGITEGGAGHRPGEFFMRVRVDKAHQGQGIGRTLYEQLLSYARANGATRLESSVQEDEPEAFAWAERRGFVKEHHLFESTLSLPDFDPTPFRESVEAVKSSGIRFTTLAAETKDGDRVAAIRRYYDFSSSLVKDIPGQADRPTYPWEPYLEWVLTDPNWKDELVLLAANGDRWVALCQLAPQHSGAIYNGLTAVDREYRGRGVALAIKVWSLEIAKSLGAPYIRTNNHSVNEPMLAVNRKLGYAPLPGKYQLAAKL